MIRCTKENKIMSLHHFPNYPIYMGAATLFDGKGMSNFQGFDDAYIDEVKNMHKNELMQYREESDRNLKILDSLYGNNRPSENFFPAIYFIEATNMCNLSCVMCPNSMLPDNKCFMEISLFKKIIDEIKNVAKVIRLNYRGEPLLHPNIIKMIRYSKENSFAKISLSTNGILLDTKLSHELIGTGIDEIIFSLDANSPHTYYNIKGSKEFDKAVKNVIEFLKLNINNNVRVILKLIQMDLNTDEIEHFRNRWDNYNCEVKISWMNTWANQLPKNKYLSNYLCPNVGKPKIPCADLWYKIAITADGSVTLCCCDFNLRHRLGNVNISNIEGIWNSHEAKYFRKIHSEHGFKDLDLCKYCGEYSGKRDISEYLDIKEFPVGRP